MDRRGFLKAAAGLAVAPVAAKVEPLVGWAGDITFQGTPIIFDAPAAGLTMSEIISATLRARAPELAANICAHNTLLERLKRR
jgi:hypothetical protein